MFDHIDSFDPYVLEDELLQLLNRSPETQKFIQLRASQIVQQLLGAPIIKSLGEEIKMLKKQLTQQKKREQISQASTSKECEYLKKQLNELKSQNKQLNVNTQINLRQINKLTKVAEAYQQLKNISASMGTDHEKLKENTLAHEKQSKKQKQSIQKYRSEVYQLNEKISKLQQRNKILIDQLDKYKHTMKNLKISDISNKKTKENLEGNYKALQQDYKNADEKLKAQMHKRQNQRKQLNFKIKQLNKKCRSYHKALINVKAKVYPKILELATDNKIIGKLFKQQVRILQKKVKQDYITIMDEIGAKMMKELQLLITKIQRMNFQIRTYKQELKIKDELISKFQRVFEQNRIGTSQLKKQLRVKKSEAQLLRKQLKKNYQQTDIKLTSLEHTYHGILYDTTQLL